MKKFVIPLLVLALSGCAHEQVKPEIGLAPAVKVPSLPDRLKQKAERLPDITDRSLGGIHKDGVASDMKYNDLALRYNALVDAWACVSTAVNSRNADKINVCFGEGQPK